MKSLVDSLRKTMAHKHWGKNMIGAIAVNEAKEYFGVEWRVYSDEVCDEYGNSVLVTSNSLRLDGYVRFNKLFLKTTDPQLKIEIFQQKNQIIKKINLALEKVGYATRIVDIITK